MQLEVKVIRHPKENLKKCSLRHLHNHSNFEFFKAIDLFSFDATGFTLLEMDAPTVSPEDAKRPILLLDSTWTLLPKIKSKVYGQYIARSLPPYIITAYPRNSKMHDDPSGLATVEALYSALKFMGQPNIEVLKMYPFAKRFLEINGWQNDAPEGFFDNTGQISI